MASTAGSTWDRLSRNFHPESTPSLKQKILAYLFVLITMSAWGSNYVVTRYILGKVPPFTILFFRYLVAAVVLLLVSSRLKARKIEPPDFKIIFLTGFVGYFLGVGALTVGTKYSNASLSSLLNAMNPILIVLFAVPILNEKITSHKIISICIAVTGAYIVIGGIQDTGFLFGAVLCLFSVCTWALVSVLAKPVMQKIHPVKVTAYALAVSVGFYLPSSALELALTPSVDLLDPVVLVSLLYMGLIPTALAYVLWNQSLTMMEAGICSLFYPIQPMVAVILGSIFLGEQMGAHFYLGAGLIIAGLMYSILAGPKVALTSDLPAPARPG
jgi:drug/metabolite transporter (DMT)-like permease